MHLSYKPNLDVWNIGGLSHPSGEFRPIDEFSRAARIAAVSHFSDEPCVVRGSEKEWQHESSCVVPAEEAKNYEIRGRADLAAASSSRAFPSPVVSGSVSALTGGHVLAPRQRAVPRRRLWDVRIDSSSNEFSLSPRGMGIPATEGYYKQEGAGRLHHYIEYQHSEQRKLDL